jgi:hypothetical protein
MTTSYQEFLKDVLGATGMEAARTMATDVFTDSKLKEKAQYILAGAATNPYFVPHLPPELEPKALMSATELHKAITFGRVAAANTQSRRIFYAAAPKTGSTFVTNVISNVLQVPFVTLSLNSRVQFADSRFGGATNEQNIDEAALLINCISPRGFIAHNHMLCSPLTANLLGMYNIRSIVTSRNIFDTLISYDDHLLRALPKSNESPTLRHAVPSDYARRDFEDRIDVLIDLKLAWYLRYYMSWQACERQELIRPLWISYENDLLGSKAALAEKLCRHIGLPETLQPVLAESLSQEGGGRMNVHKGVAGRGEQIGDKQRARIESLFSRYIHEADFSMVLN